MQDHKCPKCNKKIEVQDYFEGYSPVHTECPHCDTPLILTYDGEVFTVEIDGAA